ncbi:hypothetical protein [Phocaeicola vulgatus]|nr:hypothetical protein [Phocaeicola vulgatus]
MGCSLYKNWRRAFDNGLFPTIFRLQALYMIKSAIPVRELM